jgi:hypothetical protein
MPLLLYLAGPYRGETESDILKNIRTAEEYAMKVIEEYPDWFPVTPHLMTAWFGGLQPDDYFLKGTLEVMLGCDGVLLLPGFEGSEGAVIERDEAELASMFIVKHDEMEKLEQPDLGRRRSRKG